MGMGVKIAGRPNRMRSLAIADARNRWLVCLRIPESGLLKTERIPVVVASIIDEKGKGTLGWGLRRPDQTR